MANENPQKLLLWNPARGGLNSDTDILDMREGNLFLTEPYTGAVDIRAIGAGTNVSPSYEAIQSNKYSYKPTAEGLHNKIIRVTISSETAGNYRYTFYNGNAVLIVSTGVLAVTVGNLTTTYNTIAAGIAASLVAPQTYTISALTTTSIDNGYFEIEITTIPGWDCDVRNFSTTVIQSEFIIIQEAISGDMLGDWHGIGSNDQTGDLFHFWTTRRISTTFDVLNAIDNGAGLIRITVADTSTLTDLHAVVITAVAGTTEANGNWIIDVISATTFDLLGSAFANAYTSGGTVTDHPFGLGEIGVAVKDENNQTWTYTRLLRSKEFNFITSNQIDCRAKRKQDGNIAVYFVQGHGLPKNPPRVFYIKQPYITDGGLALNGGIYNYGSIGRELITILSVAGFDIQIVGQIQSGGNILSGNWRYAMRLGTTNADFTGWSYLTNPIQAGEGDENGTIGLLFGNGAGTPTIKQNILQITNPLPDLFTYIEIAAVNYLDTGFTGEIIGRYTLNGQATQQIIHTGNELNNTDIPGGVGALQTIEQIVQTVGNIELHDNRQAWSDIMVNTFPDLSAFFASFEFTLGYASVAATVSFIINGAGGACGQYQISMNEYNRLGYMLNERYRFFGVAEFIDGSRSAPFFIRDVIFNTDGTQPGCVTPLADFNLTNDNTADPNARAFLIDFHGFNIDTVVDGRRIRDFVSNIYIFRQELENKMVVASGIVIPAVSNRVSSVNTIIGWVDGVPNFVLGEFPFPAGVTVPTDFILDDYFYGSAIGANDLIPDRAYASFYSWDFTNGHQPYSPQVNFDYILTYGQPRLRKANYADSGLNDFLVETSGFTGIDPTGGTFPPTANPGFLNIAEAISIGYFGLGTINALSYSKNLSFTAAGVPYIQNAAAPAGFVFRTDTPGGFLPQTTGFFVDSGYANGDQDRALYLAQIIHPYATGDDQYGAIKDAKVVWTGARIHIDETTPTIYPSGTTFVFGGDTFTQKVWFKNRYPQVHNGVLRGFGQGIGYFSQHRTNFDMRANAGNGTFPSTVPLIGATQWLSRNGTTDVVRPPDELFYNEGYTPRNDIQIYKAFNILQSQQSDWRNAIMWSDIEVDGSNTDALRNFPPLNLKFLDYTNGVITELKRLNGELITLQQRYIERQFFNTTASTTSEEGQQIILGGAPVFAYKGQAVTNFGCSHKWSVIIGKSDKGNQVMYFYDESNKTICRIGYDGTNSLDEIHGIKSFLANYTRFIIGKYKPAHDQGICTVANQRFREVNFTFIGYKSGIEIWNNGVPVYLDRYDFDTPTGDAPVAGVIEVDGNLYGMTSTGGANGTGVIFSYNIATNVYTVLHDFANATGESPDGALLLGSNGLLYGTTTIGGVNNNGVIFSYNISTDTYTNLFDFGGGAGTAIQPQSTLIEVSGILYGTTATGGVNNTGVIFSYNIGTTVFAIIHSFAITGGIGNELLYDSGNLYGTTFNGGATSEGELFQFNIGTATFTSLHDFANATGSDTSSGVVLTNGKLYGITFLGGASNFGVLYEYDIVNVTYTVLHTFTGIPDGANPQAGLLLIANVLYGCATSGGLNNEGTIYSYNIGTGAFTNLYDFTNATGAFPVCKLLLSSNGQLIGTTGSGGVNNDGVLFYFDILSGVYQTGDVVASDNINFSHVPQFYISLIDNNINLLPSDNPDAWQIISQTDKNYYSYFTLVFSELKNVFLRTCEFKDAFPKICFAPPKFTAFCIAPDKVGFLSEAYRNLAVFSLAKSLSIFALSAGVNPVARLFASP